MLRPTFVVRKHYNRRSLWLSSSCERASFKCNKAQVCKYADSFAQTHSLTFIGATSRFVWPQSSLCSTRYIIVGVIRPMLHQRDITSTAPECSMLLCFKQQVRLFLAIIVFSVFRSNCIYFRNRSSHSLRYFVYKWKWLLLWFFMTLNIVCRYTCVFL